MKYTDIRCLVFDLDKVLFYGSPSSRVLLKNWLDKHPDIFIVYCTGRSLSCAVEILFDPIVPSPDLVICDIGCSVYDKDLNFYEPIHSDISSMWPGKSFVLKSIPFLNKLKIQSCDMVNRLSFKMSLDEFKVYASLLKEFCQKHNFDYLFSHDQFLDILPAFINKGTTLLKVLKQLNISPQQTIAFGDSENDLSMLTCGVNGVFLGDVKALDKQVLEVVGDKQYSLGCDGILQALNISADRQCYENKSKLLQGLVYHRVPDVFNSERSHPNGILSGILPVNISNAPIDFYLALSVGEKNDNLGTNIGFKIEQVTISKRERDLFYHVASRNMLWPIFHDMPSKAQCDDEAWRVFCDINERIAHKLAQMLGPSAKIWLHDYNLILIPGYLKALRADIKIGYFHHIPWSFASMNSFWHKDLILNSLKYANVIAMHIPHYLKEFCRSYENDYTCKVTSMVLAQPCFVTQDKRCMASKNYPQKLSFINSVVRLSPLPMPVNAELVRKLLPEISTLQMEGKKVILFIARLDYVKGAKELIDFLFDFFVVKNYMPKEDLEFNFYLTPTEYDHLEPYQEYQSSVICAYQRLNEQLSAKYGKRVTINLYRDTLRGKELYEVYARSHILIIPSLRDGLNLIAKEFLLVNGLLEQKGVVLASEGAGVSVEIQELVTYNPYRASSFCDKFAMILNKWPVFSPSSFERLNEYLFQQDCSKWSEKMFELLD